MGFLRKMLFPISLIYGLAVRVRNFLFDKGWRASKSFKTPTISVGNLSVGGTGKTPMIEFLIRQLREEFTLAVLSRGYKRKSKGFLLANNDHTVEDLGDEPYQIKKKFPGIHVAVDGNRSRGIQQLENSIAPEVILLDDAFQHRKVTPRFSILLTTYDQPYYKDWFLPTGNLRDAKNQAKRASAIVVTKCPPTITTAQKKKLQQEVAYFNQQPVYFATLKYQDTLISENREMSISELLGKPFTLVTGIANAAPLVNHLKNQGLQFKHLEFSDHHYFTPKDLDTIPRNNPCITTEKDYVRLVGRIEDLYFVRIAHQFLDAGEKGLMDQIEDSITPYPQRSL